MPKPTTRMQVLAPLSSPDWNPTSESYGMPWDDATKLIDRLIAENRGAAYREAAELVAPSAHRCKCSSCSELREKANLLRAKADEIAPAAAPIEEPTP